MRFIGRALLSALLLLSVPALANDVSNGSYSTTDGSNNAAPPNGWPAGMFPNQVEPSARANMGATKRWWERANAGLSTTGAAGAYVLTPTNTSYPTAYTQGEVYCAKANFTAVGNDTLNVNSLGAKPIYAPSINTSTNAISRIAASTILSGQQFCVTYDASLNTGSGGFQLQTPRAGLLPFGGATTLYNGQTAWNGGAGIDTGISANATFQAQGVLLMAYCSGQNGPGNNTLSGVYLVRIGATGGNIVSATRIALDPGSTGLGDFIFSATGGGNINVTPPGNINTWCVLQQMTG